MDVTHVELTSGQSAEVLNIIDDQSRLCDASACSAVFTSSRRGYWPLSVGPAPGPRPRDSRQGPIVSEVGGCCRSEAPSRRPPADNPIADYEVPIEDVIVVGHIIRDRYDLTLKGAFAVVAFITGWPLWAVGYRAGEQEQSQGQLEAANTPQRGAASSVPAAPLAPW